MTTCPISGFRGEQRPVGVGTSGVLILGEAMGDHEYEAGYGFVESAPAGSVLERAIRRCGFSRDQFVLWNAVPSQPPHNWLEGAPYEAEALAWGRPLLDEIIKRTKPNAILALGNIALGETGGLRGITVNRGYPLGTRWGIPTIGSLHPSYLRRGAMSYLGVLMHDLKFAVALAAQIAAIKAGLKDDGPSPIIRFWSPVLWRDVAYHIPLPLPPTTEPRPERGYVCYPTEVMAEFFYRLCEDQPERMIAYDIETPHSDNTPEDELDKLEGDEILSVQFSLGPGSGIFLPFRKPFIDVANRILALDNPKAGANIWRFDDPRLRTKDIRVAGTRHDLRWAWRHFQPDLSAALQFIASFYAPDMGPWKHLKAHKEWYGIRDVDACHRILA